MNQHSQHQNSQYFHSRRHVAEKKLFAILFVTLMLASIIGSAQIGIVSAETPGTEAKIWTDKADYHPGTNVTIFGSNFLPNTLISLNVTKVKDGTTTSWSTRSDANGNFSTAYQIDKQGAPLYNVIATDGTNTATKTFTDSSPGLDAHGENNNDASSLTLPITTTGTNDIIYAAAYVPFTTGTFSISDNTGTLTWHDRTGSDIITSFGRMHVWYAISTAPITNKIITISQTVNNQHLAILFVAFSGVNTNNPFDPAWKSVPPTPIYGTMGGTATNVPLTFSVTDNNDFVVGFLCGADNAYTSTLTNYQLIGNNHGHTVSASSEYNLTTVTSGSVSPGFKVTGNKQYILVADAFAPAPTTLDHFTFSTVSSPQVAGTGFSVTVTAYDASGNVKTDFTGSVSLSESNGGTVSPASLTIVSGGQVTGSVSVSKIGTGVTLGASGGGKSGTSGSFNVNPGALNQFTISVPGSTTAGSSFGSVTVTAYDANNNIKTDYTGQVYFQSSDGGAITLPYTSGSKYTFVGGDSGVHTFSGFTLVTAGSQTLTVTDGSVSQTSSSITVTPGTVATFVFSTIGLQTAGTAITGVTIKAEDSWGNTVTSYASSTSLTETGNGAGGTVTPASAPFSGGTWSGSSFTLSKPGTAVSVTANGGGQSGASNTFDLQLTQPITVTLSNSATSATVTIIGGNPSPATFAGDGSQHSITMDQGASFTLSFSNSGNTRNGFSVSSAFSATSSSYSTSTTPISVTAYEQVQNTFTVTGLTGSDTAVLTGAYLGTGSSTIVTLATGNGWSISAWSDYNTAVTFPVSSSGSTSSERYSIANAYSTAALIAGGNTYSQVYVHQYKVTFYKSGIGTDFTGTVLTVDSVDYNVAGFPSPFWWNAESSHTFSFASPLVVNSTVSYTWAYTTGGLSTQQSETLTISASGIIDANYFTTGSVSFVVTGVQADFTGTVVTIDGIPYTLSTLPSSFAWSLYSTHTFTFQSPLVVTSNGKQYIWTHNEGLSELQSDSINITSFGPLEGYFQTQFYMTVQNVVMVVRLRVLGGLTRAMVSLLQLQVQRIRWLMIING